MASPRRPCRADSSAIVSVANRLSNGHRSPILPSGAGSSTNRRTRLSGDALLVRSAAAGFAYANSKNDREGEARPGPGQEAVDRGGRGRALGNRAHPQGAARRAFTPAGDRDRAVESTSGGRAAEAAAPR